jgi:hypothetical protein
VIHETYIRPTHASRYDAYDDISCVLDSGNASVFISKAEVVIKHERRIALEQDKYTSFDQLSGFSRLTASIGEVTMMSMFLV